MKLLLILISATILVSGSPFKPTPAPDDSDKLEAFPWIKASKAKARFGPTTQPPCTTSKSVPVAEVPVAGQQLPIQPLLTPEALQAYIAALAAQLQPFVANTPPPQPASAPTTTPSPPWKKYVKSKSPKLKVREVEPVEDTTTEAYWVAEKKIYPDSLYDEFYLDWLRKRQVEEVPVATPTSVEEEVEPASSAVPHQSQPQAPAPQTFQPYPSVPLAMNPYFMNPYMLPLAGLKVSKAMANAQVSAALAALNITTTPKPVKIKLKIPIPAGSDVAQVVASGIAGFPTGTTYELSKKK